VGKISELIKQCSEKTYAGWGKRYLERHPHAIDMATQRIKAMVDNLKAMELIDEKMYF